MDLTALRLGIDDLNAAYADCIDDDRLEEWPDFFALEGCRYLVTSRESHEVGWRHGIIYCASHAMLRDRIMTLRRASMFEPHRYRHLIGPARLGKVENGIAEARANFMAARIMHDGATTLFATGRYLDRIAIGRTPFRFVERTVVLDSQKIDTLLVIPL